MPLIMTTRSFQFDFDSLSPSTRECRFPADPLRLPSLELAHSYRILDNCFDQSLEASALPSLVWEQLRNRYEFKEILPPPQNSPAPRASQTNRWSLSHRLTTLCGSPNPSSFYEARFFSALMDDYPPGVELFFKISCLINRMGNPFSRKPLPPFFWLPATSRFFPYLPPSRSFPSRDKCFLTRRVVVPIT